MNTPLETYTFETFVHNLNQIDFINSELSLVEDSIATIDQHIEETDEVGLEEVMEQLCSKRNELNLKRINLELEKNKLEKQILEFEKVQAMSK